MNKAVDKPYLHLPYLVIQSIRWNNQNWSQVDVKVDLGISVCKTSYFFVFRTQSRWKISVRQWKEFVFTSILYCYFFSLSLSHLINKKSLHQIHLVSWIPWVSLYTMLLVTSLILEFMTRERKLRYKTVSIFHRLYEREFWNLIFPKL